MMLGEYFLTSCRCGVPLPRFRGASRRGWVGLRAEIGTDTLTKMIPIGVDGKLRTNI